MANLFVTFIAGLFGIGVSAPAAANDWMDDPTEATAGVHLLSDYGSDHKYLSSDISIAAISEEIRKLDWQENFYQFVVVMDPGISMEVGGSMNGIDGLSAMYRNRHDRIVAVIKEPPENVTEMIDILDQFISGTNEWMHKHDFEFSSY